MLISYIRTIFLYLILVLVVRLMGKRQIGEMEPAEFVVTMLLANLAAIPMQDSGIPLMSGLIPIFTVLGVQILLAVASMRWIGFRQMLCGKPVILVADGVIQERNLRRARITLDELTQHLREKDVLDLSQVQYAILETNGQISVFLHARFLPASAQDAGVAVETQLLPITIISDGRLLRKNLALTGKDERWLQKILKKEGASIESTLLLTVDKNNKIYLARKELPQ